MTTKLDAVWATRFVKAWNRSGCQRSLAGFGVVRFEILDRPGDGFGIAWDGAGEARTIVEDHKHEYLLLASHEIWMEFLAGNIRATQAVMDGRIAFEGDYRTALPFTQGFSAIAEVGRKI